MEPKIDKKTAKRMIVVAGTFDALDFAIDALSLGTIGAIISPFLTILAYGTMGIWFVRKGVSLRNAKNFLWFNGTFMFELIPYLGDLPALTAGTIRMISITNGEVADIPVATLSGIKPNNAAVLPNPPRPSVPPPTTGSYGAPTGKSPNVLTLSSPGSGAASPVRPS